MALLQNGTFASSLTSSLTLVFWDQVMSSEDDLVIQSGGWICCV